MLKLIAGLLLMGLLTGSGAASLNLGPGLGLTQDHLIVLPLPAIELEMPDVVRILAEYNVEQQDSKTFCQQYNGMTNFDNRTIELCDRTSSAQKQKTLLHELYHIQYFQRGIYTGGPYEAQIQAMAQARFAELFGLPPAVDIGLKPNSLPIEPPVCEQK